MRIAPYALASAIAAASLTAAQDPSAGLTSRQSNMTRVMARQPVLDTRNSSRVRRSPVDERSNVSRVMERQPVLDIGNSSRVRRSAVHEEDGTGTTGGLSLEKEGRLDRDDPFEATLRGINFMCEPVHHAHGSSHGSHWRDGAHGGDGKDGEGDSQKRDSGTAQGNDNAKRGVFDRKKDHESHAKIQWNGKKYKCKVPQSDDGPSKFHELDHGLDQAREHLHIGTEGVTVPTPQNKNEAERGARFARSADIPGPASNVKRLFGASKPHLDRDVAKQIALGITEDVTLSVVRMTQTIQIPPGPMGKKFSMGMTQSADVANGTTLPHSGATPSFAGPTSQLAFTTVIAPSPTKEHKWRGHLIHHSPSPSLDAYNSQRIAATLTASSTISVTRVTHITLLMTQSVGATTAEMQHITLTADVTSGTTLAKAPVIPTPKLSSASPQTTYTQVVSPLSTAGSSTAATQSPASKRNASPTPTEPGLTTLAGRNGQTTILQRVTVRDAADTGPILTAMTTVRPSTEATFTALTLQATTLEKRAEAELIELKARCADHGNSDKHCTGGD